MASGFCNKLVNSVLNFPNGQVKCFLDFKLQISGSQSRSLLFSNVGMKHDNLVQHYMILLYVIIIINSLCILQSGDNLFHGSCVYFFILVLFRIQQHIAEPYFKIVSRTTQLRRLQVSLVTCRFWYVSRNIHAILILLKLEVTSYFTPNINLQGK